MVMFLFVIAYLGDRSDESPWSGGPSWQIVGAVLAGGAILAEVIVVVGLEGRRLPLEAAATSAASFGSPEAIGRLFLTDHLLAFEVTSIVLLVAAVGGVVLGSHARTDRRAMHGPDIQWYVVLSGAALRDRRARRDAAPHPLIILLSVEIMLNSREPAADRVLAAARPRGRPDLRDLGDGGRRVRGRRRARADRRAWAGATSSSTSTSCRTLRGMRRRRLDLPAAAACLDARDHARRHAHLAPRRRLRLDAHDDGRRSPPRSSRSSTMLGETPAIARARHDVVDVALAPGRTTSASRCSSTS